MEDGEIFAAAAGGQSAPRFVVTSSRYFASMWDLPDSHRRVLEQIRDGDSDDIDPTVLDELRRWGMLMPKSLELTGMGRRYAAGGKQRLL